MLISTVENHAGKPPQPAAGAEPQGDRTGGVASAAIALLDQCSTLVRQVTPRAYTGPSAVLQGGTIGKHVRHTLDHFRAALDGSRQNTVIDYDRRERNVPMETDPAAALHAISGLRERLAAIRAADLERPVRVRLMLSGDGHETELVSTLGRELAFAAHHAVHHHAMVAAIAAEFGLGAPADFGKAPSTINHERTIG